jgi:inhibitor of KinA
MPVTEICALGDSALVVRVAGNTVTDNATDIVIEVLDRLRAAQIPGVVEFAPSYTSIGVFYDPIGVSKSGPPFDGIQTFLEERIKAALGKTARPKSRKTRTVEIPVCYDPEFGADLDRVAEHALLSVEQIIELHCSAQYCVSCIGFTPGFPYLSGLADKLITPRLPTPRKEVPAGSVAIGGKQTGIYPLKSPGGWNIIGRTPLCLFDPNEQSPALLRVGDRIRFRAITREQFERSIS